MHHTELRIESDRVRMGENTSAYFLGVVPIFDARIRIETLVDGGNAEEKQLESGTIYD
ncbi:hypothetical protein BH20ACT21_BH20ACT21_10140 [soil metagenome]